MVQDARKFAVQILLATIKHQRTTPMDELKVGGIFPEA
jgi:hypothetical protein